MPRLLEAGAAVDVRSTFGVDFDFKAPAFSERDPHVPDIDEAYEEPELVKTAPHNQAIHQVDASGVDVPAVRPTVSAARNQSTHRSASV